MSVWRAGDVFGAARQTESLFADHLGLDAVVAFTDGALSLTAFQRAAAHVTRCQQCANEVAEQQAARQGLRAAPCPSMPTELMKSLLSIPVALPIKDDSARPRR